MATIRILGREEAPRPERRRQPPQRVYLRLSDYPSAAWSSYFEARCRTCPEWRARDVHVQGRHVSVAPVPAPPAPQELQELNLVAAEADAWQEQNWPPPLPAGGGSH